MVRPSIKRTDWTSFPKEAIHHLMKRPIPANSDHGISPILYSLPCDIYGVGRSRSDALANVALVGEAAPEVGEQLLPLLARAAIGARGVDHEDEVATAARGGGGGGGVVGGEAHGAQLGARPDQ